MERPGSGSSTTSTRGWAIRSSTSANLSINNGLSEGAQETLLRFTFGEVTDGHRARLQLMRIMSDFREAMWGVIQQALSTLDIDYVAYADRHFDRLERSMADERFEDWLRQAAEAI